MAECLVWIVDRLPSSDPLYHVTYKAGDVIAICPDGWAWSNAELDEPRWVILKLPSVAPEMLQALTAPLTRPVTGELQLKRAKFLAGAAHPTIAAALSTGKVSVTLTTVNARAAFNACVATRVFAGGAQVVVG